MVKFTYWLGWVSLAAAVVARILLPTSAGVRMAAMHILPRNFLELTVVFFLASIASYTCSRSSKA